jgi:hypothetical protein
MKTIAAYLCAVALALIAFAPLASAAGNPPELLSYQGYLVDADGVPLGTNEAGEPFPANYDVIFRIHSASAGGTLLWAEEQTITVDNGYFSVLLGEGAVSGSEPRPNLSTVFTGIGADERFVGISVRFQAGGEFSDILPRLRLLSSPYSFLSSQTRALVNPDGQSLLTAEGDEVTVAGTLNLTGPLNAVGDLNVTGPLNAVGDLSVTGALSVTGPLSTTGTFSAASLSGNGANLTNLNASRLTTGTVADARLSGNIARLNAEQTFTSHITINGRTNFNAQLRVNGWADSTHTFAYYNGNAQIGIAQNHHASYSIWSHTRVAATEFNAMSDARIKEVAGLSDPVQDLATIRRLRVTDYYSVDKVAEGDDLKKGFIAQEVAEVIPGAVSLSEQFIPDIYALPTELAYNEAAKQLRIVLSDAHGLEEGDTVRIITSDTTLELPVASVTSPEEFVLGSVERKPEQVFVYGKHVSDFRTVHYDRIFTTGIGAIQELAREVDALRKRTAELEEELSRMRSIEGKLAGLQATVEALVSVRAAVDAPSEEMYAEGGGEE